MGRATGTTGEAATSVTMDDERDSGDIEVRQGDGDNDDVRERMNLGADMVGTVAGVCG